MNPKLTNPIQKKLKRKQVLLQHLYLLILKNQELEILKKRKIIQIKTVRLKKMMMDWKIWNIW